MFTKNLNVDIVCCVIDTFQLILWLKGGYILGFDGCVD